MNHSPLRRATAVFLASLMLVVSLPLVAVADTVRDINRARQGIFSYPNPADFGFSELEIGEAFGADSASMTTTPTAPEDLPEELPLTPDTPPSYIPEEDLPQDIYLPEEPTELRYPHVVVEEIDPDLLGLGDPIEVGEFHKTFQVDATSYRTVISTDPNYFTTSLGTTQSVDTDLEHTLRVLGNNYLTPKATPLNATFPVDLDQSDKLTVRFEHEGQRLSFTHPEGDFSNAAYLANTVLYNEVFENIDIEHRHEAFQSHIAAHILTETDKDSFTFEIDTHGLALEELDGQILFFDEDTEVIAYTLLAPQLIDADQNISIATSVTVDNLREDIYTLTLSLDSEWTQAPERAFPLNLNLSLERSNTTTRQLCVVRTVTQRRLYGGRAHGYVGNMRAAYLGVPGARDFGFARYMIYFSTLQGITPGIPSTARIDSAQLRIFQFMDRSNGAMRIEARRLFAPWNPDTINWARMTAMRVEPTSTGSGFVQQSRRGYRNFDIRTAIENIVTGRETHRGFVLRARNEAHSVSGLATNSSNPNSNRGFQTSWRPHVIINWTPAPRPSPNFPLNGTTIRMAPMVQNQRTGRINVLGTFAYGRAREGSVVQWDRRLYRTTPTFPNFTLARETMLFPDSLNFESQLGNPNRVSIFAGRRENWQINNISRNLTLNTYFQYHARAVAGSNEGRPTRSQRFIIYRVTGIDTLDSIANFYRVPRARLIADNRVPDMLIVQGNTLFIRNPRVVQRHFTSAPPNRSEQARINNLLLGQGKNVMFSLDPVNINTGNFWLWEEDFSIDSLGAPFQIKRDYNSMRANYMSPFGRGWSFGFNETLIKTEDYTIAYNRGDGSTLEFIEQGNSFRAEFAGHHYELRRIPVGTNSITWGRAPETYTVYEWEVLTEANERRRFNSSGQLTTITDYRGRVTTLERNNQGMITAIIDPSNLRYTITHDNIGRITSIALPSGGTLRYTYDRYDNLISFTDASGRVTRYTYDSQHRMVSWYNPLGTRMIYNTYDSQNRVTRQIDGEGGISYINYLATHPNGVTSRVRMTDALGNLTYLSVDSEGRKTRIEHPDGSYEAFFYTGGNPSQVTDRAGNVTTRGFDARGNIISEFRADGTQASWTYNARGQVLTHTDFCGMETQNTYDAQGNLTQVRVNGQITQTFTHDSLGRVLTQTDALGNTTTFTYTAQNPEPATITDALGNTTRFYYNSLRNLITTVDAQGNIARNTFDADGNLTSETDFTGALTQYRFTQAGSTSSITDARGFETTFTYSPWGYMESVTDALGNTFTKTYDYLGNQLSLTNPLGYSTYFIHDEAGRVVEEIDPQGLSTRFEYDGAGNLIRTTDPLGVVTETVYCTILETPTSRIDGRGYETRYTLNARGQIIERISPTGATSTYTFDNFARLTQETSPLGLVTNFEYNEAGWLVRESNSEGAYTTYTHDPLGRVLSATDNLGNIRRYVYDELGNLTRQVDALGNITTFEHDAEGRVIATTDALGNTTRTTFDAVGNVVATEDALGNITRTIYDAVEQQVGTIAPNGAETKVIFDAAGRAVQEIDAYQNTTTFVYDASDRLIAVYNALDQATYFEHDKAGNIVKETDPRGAETRHYFDQVGNEVATRHQSGLHIMRAFDGDNRQISEFNNLGHFSRTYFDDAGNVVRSINPLEQEETFEYNTLGQLTQETDTRGNITIHTYDTQGNLITTTCPEGHTTTFEYDALGRQTQRTDGHGRIWKTEYDALGNVTSTTDPLGATTTFEFDALGRQIREICAAGIYSKTAFDEMGNPTSQTDRRRHSTTLEYDLLGRLIKTTDPRGAQTAIIYDELGQVEKIRDPLGNVTRFEYDNAGNQRSIQNPEGGTTYTDFDLSGRQIAETDPLGNITFFEHDLLSRPTTQTLPNGATFAFEYDKLGRVVKETGPEGTYTTNTFNNYGDLVTRQDQKGRVFEYTFDTLGRQLSSTNPLGGVETQTFDTRGNLTSTTTPLGHTTTFEHDLLDRVIRQVEPSGLVTVFEYGSCTDDCCTDTPVSTPQNTSCCQDQVTRILQGDGLTMREVASFTYDPEGNLTSETDALGNTRHFTFDEVGNLIQETDAKGQTTTFEYDLAGQVIRETDPLGAIQNFEHDALGNVTRISDPLGRESTFSFNNAGQIMRAGAGLIGSNYTWDSTGNLTSRTNDAGHTTHFEHDKLGRQTAIVDALEQRETFEYDTSGNLERHTRPDESVITYEHDALDRLTTRTSQYEPNIFAAFEYDADSNRTSMTDLTGTSTFEYDQAGRLISATSPCGSTVRYTYDIFSNITSITYPDGTTVRYEFDYANRLSTVTCRQGTITRYFYDSESRPIRIERPQGITTHIEYDERGNLTRIENRSNTDVVSSFAYRFDLSGRIIRETAYQAGRVTVSDFEYDASAQLIRIESRQGRAQTTIDFTYDLTGNRIQATITESGKATRTINYSYDEAGQLILKTDSRYGSTLFSYDPNGNQVSRLVMSSEVGRTGELTTYSFDALGRLEAVAKGGTLLLAALYDADNNRVFSALRDPDPELDQDTEQQLTDTDTGNLFFAATDLSQESTETTPTPKRLTEDTTNNHTPPTLVTEHDLFWYGVAQGISNLSNKAPFLTVWLNRIWTLDLEESRTEWVVAAERTRYAETLTGHVERLADYLHIPDALPQDGAQGQEHTDTINFEQFTINRYINDINRDYPRTLAQYNQEGIWTHTFTHDTGILGVNGVIALDTQEGREHLLTDGRGSITEALGIDITTYRYDAFGNVQRQGSSLNPFTYNQERFDFASGLQFLRARYVDLSLGRFISRDTVLGTLEDPRTHNLYLYVQNDPLNAIDPSGHIMVVGNNIRQTANVWNNCNVCRRNTRNIPSHLNSCLRCGRVRPQCRACDSGREVRGNQRCSSCGSGRRGVTNPSRHPSVRPAQSGSSSSSVSSSRARSSNVGSQGFQPMGPNLITGRSTQSNVGNKSGAAVNRSFKKNSNAVTQSRFTFSGEVDIMLTRSIEFDIRLEVWGVIADHVAQALMIVAGGVMQFKPHTAAAGQNLIQIASTLPPGTVGIIVLRGTMNYSEIVFLRERATGFRFQVTTPGQRVVSSYASYGSNLQQQAARRAIERQLHSRARGIAISNGNFWARPGGVISGQSTISRL